VFSTISRSTVFPIYCMWQGPSSLFRILTNIDSKKLGEGLVDVVTGIDLPQVTPRNTNVCTTTIELFPA